MKDFLREESASGIVLIVASLAAMIWANSAGSASYAGMQHVEFGFTLPFYALHMDLHAWIDDGLMALFFFLVGLEIKREIREGELASLSRAALPLVAAAGGMIVPAAICAAFVVHDPQRAAGWAIPAATDIAFALAALAIFGRSLPPAVRVLLTALAVIDDLGAIVIIAIFYTPALHLAALLAAIGCIALLVVLNRLRVHHMAPYAVGGVLIWAFVHASGIHATLAGVATAFTVPMAIVRRAEHALHPYVAFLVVPIFGLFNAGLALGGLQPAVLLQPLPLGILLGLLVGKPAGIFGSSWIAIRAGIQKPRSITWPMLFGVAVLGGIGFTMSLFIGSLAFGGNDAFLTETKVGVFAGSLLAGALGCTILAFVVKRTS